MEYVVPVGYHFLPSDIELISYFLHMKINGEPFPPHQQRKILERSIYGKDANPWDVLKEDDPAWVDVEGCPTKKILFVFCKQTLTKTGGQRVSRTAGCGTWDGKATNHAIKDNNGVVIGQMRQFSFKPKKGFKNGAEGRGHWIMHEYSIEQDNYVLCRITKDMSKGVHNSDSSTRSDQEVIGTSSMITANGNKRNFSEVINIGDHGISSLLINETEEESKKRREIIWVVEEEDVLGNITFPNDYGGVEWSISEEMMMSSNIKGGYECFVSDNVNNFCEASASASTPAFGHSQEVESEKEDQVLILPDNNNSKDLQIINHQEKEKEEEWPEFDDVLLDLSEVMGDDE